MATDPRGPHIWYTPADCSALLLGMRHGDTYRAPCPVCLSSRTDALSIREMPDRYGNPCTVLHCFAHDCDIRDICDVLGIEMRNLFSVQPDYAARTKRYPRAHSPRIERLKSMEDPTPEEIAQIMLEEMIVSDPAWIQECEPARTKMWELAQASPKSRARLTHALRDAALNPVVFWDSLARQMNG